MEQGMAHPKIPILLVDDRPENLTALEGILADMDLDLVRALSGNDALRCVLKTDFALVLLDVQMPDMDGFETADLIRANPKTSRVPIIFITAGMKEEQHLFKGYETGAVDYLVKPVEPSILRGKVRVFSDLYRQRRELEARENTLEDEVRKRTASLEEAVAQLDLSKSRYQRLLESVTSYVYTVTFTNGHPAGTIHRDGCRTVTGFAKEEYAAQPDLWYRMVFEEDRQAVLDVAAGILNAEKPLTIEHRIRHKDGSLRWIRHTLVPNRGSNSHLLSYDGIIEDISERKRSEEEREKLEEQLRQAQKMEAIGILAGGVAHDFNNVLSAIVGYASIVIMKMEENDPLRPHIAQILAATERAAGLTKSLLAFSRKQQMELSPVNINEMVQGFQKILARIIGEDIDFRVICAPGTLVVEADRGQLEQVLMNLAVNSRDAMPKGGTLRVSTGETVIDADQGELRKGAYAVISVSDSGIGMDKKTREHIFEPFYTTKEVGKGTGLGLAIVYGIVTKHNGHVEVQSEPGKGTTIRIYLPRCESPALKPAEQDAVPIPRGTETILLVEDDLFTRRIARVLLEEFGYSVLEAVDGEHAVQTFRENQDRIALILCDLVMPKKNGREAVDEIARIRSGVKTIFTSGYTADIIAQEAILRDGINFISKPFNPTDLMTKVRKVLDS